MARSKSSNPSGGLAKQADKYELYQQSVQEPTVDVRFFDRVYRSVFGQKPRVLREDFCGTFAVCCEWVKLGPDRTAVGIDLDPEPLDWGRRHNLAPLPKEAQQRVRLVQSDVRASDDQKADVLSAQNFSFWIFTTRAELLAYLRTAYDNLAPRGVMVLDMMGGPDCLKEGHTDKRRKKGFVYEWHQARFDPITHQCRFHIHFKFPDGSRLNRAFTYDWRMWSIPELRDLLAEAGFDRTEVYWEGTDRATNKGNGVYSRRKQAPSDPAWVTYVAAIKEG